MYIMFVYLIAYGKYRRCVFIRWYIEWMESKLRRVHYTWTLISRFLLDLEFVEMFCFVYIYEPFNPLVLR